MPDAYPVVEKQRRQDERAGDLDVLRVEQHLAAVQAIREDAPEQRKQHDRQLAQKEIQTQIERVLGQVVDEPALGKLLDIGARRRNAGSNPHQAKIAVPKGSKGALEEWKNHGQTCLSDCRGIPTLPESCLAEPRLPGALCAGPLEGS